MKTTSSHRPERVASVIKRSVALILETEVSDPRIHGVSVVDVTVSRDLRYATVYVYIGVCDGEQVLDALTKSAGFIRARLSERISEMRVMPQLKFEQDKSQDYYEHIDRIIKDIHNEGNK